MNVLPLETALRVQAQTHTEATAPAPAEPASCDRAGAWRMSRRLALVCCMTVGAALGGCGVFCGAGGGSGGGIAGGCATGVRF